MREKTPKNKGNPAKTQTKKAQKHRQKTKKNEPQNSRYKTQVRSPRRERYPMSITNAATIIDITKLESKFEPTKRTGETWECGGLGGGKEIYQACKFGVLSYSALDISGIPCKLPTKRQETKLVRGPNNSHAF